MSTIFGGGGDGLTEREGIGTVEGEEEAADKTVGEDSLARKQVVLVVVLGVGYDAFNDLEGCVVEFAIGGDDEGVELAVVFLLFSLVLARFLAGARVEEGFDVMADVSLAEGVHDRDIDGEGRNVGIGELDL